MAKKARERRLDKRHSLPEALPAEIQFKGPDGIDYNFSVIDLSATGVSFHMPRAVLGIEPGALLADAVLRLGRLEIQGNLSVLRVSKLFGSSRTCGVQFFPKTEEDRNELINVIARLESLPGT